MSEKLKTRDKIFWYVDELTQEDLDRAFEKLSEQDKVVLDRLALAIVASRKDANAHIQFSTKAAFELLAKLGILFVDKGVNGGVCKKINPYGEEVIE